MHPLVEKFILGTLPEPMAQALVGGSLPVPVLELLQALAHAVFQGTPFAPKALETLLGMPEEQLASAIIGPVEPPDPLGLILIHRREPLLLETVLLHESLNAEWMERAVPHLPGKLLEIPLNNQVLWMERPVILDLLETHPEAEYVIKRRVNEFRRDVLHQIPGDVAQDRLEIIDEVEAGRLDAAWASLPTPAPESDEERTEAEAARRERLTRPTLDEDGNEIPLNLTQRVLKLNTNQKIMLAIKGGKE